MKSTPLTKASKRSRFFRVLQLLTIAYLLLVVLMLVLQRRLLFLPTKIPLDTALQAAKERGFVPWKNPAGHIIGWEIPADGPATGSVLIVHGNGGCALDRDYIARPIHEAAPVNVYVLEYPGYGARGGSPSRKSLDAAAADAFQLLPAGLPKYVVGESLGAGVACNLTKNHPQTVAGLALLVPYDNLASVAQRRFWFLPAYFLLFDRFNPAESLRSYHGPVKFVVAGADEILGSASGLRLANGYGGPKELQIIAGAHHNDVSGQPPEWWREVFSFWRKNARVILK